MEDVFSPLWLLSAFSLTSLRRSVSCLRKGRLLGSESRTCSATTAPAFFEGVRFCNG